MYICDKCLTLVEELPTSEVWGEAWGIGTGWVEVADDCSCGGTFVKAKKCFCGEYIPSEGCNHRRSLVAKYQEIPEEFIREYFDAEEWLADEDDYCEDCLEDRIKKYQEVENGKNN